MNGHWQTQYHYFRLTITEPIEISPSMVLFTPVLRSNHQVYTIIMQSILTEVVLRPIEDRSIVILVIYKYC